MNVRCAVLIALAGLLAAADDVGAQPPSVAAVAARPLRAARAAIPVPGSPSAAYATMSDADRIALQADLVLTGDYDGVPDGEPGEALINAVKAWQKRNGGRESGILGAEERARLAEAARSRRQRIGLRMVDDRVSGIRLGVPATLVQQPIGLLLEATGSRWRSVHGEIEVETFRLSGPDVTLAKAFDEQKKEPAWRRLERAVLRPESFVLAGLQRQKKFQVRAQFKDGEVRGFAVLYDQALDVVMDAAAAAMAQTFAPFPESLTGSLPPRRRVEYATAVALTADGVLASDAHALADCNMVRVAGRGPAEIEASQDGIALLRLRGARRLPTLSLAVTPPREGELTLVGVADPRGQAGGHTVSTVRVRLAATGGMLAPPPGFAGAPAIDTDGRVAGLVVSPASPPQLAGPASPALASSGLVPAPTIAALLARIGADSTKPVAGRSGPEAARAAVMRVICVRD